MTIPLDLERIYHEIDLAAAKHIQTWNPQYLAFYPAKDKRRATWERELRWSSAFLEKHPTNSDE